MRRVVSVLAGEGTREMARDPALGVLSPHEDQESDEREMEWQTALTVRERLDARSLLRLTRVLRGGGPRCGGGRTLAD